MKGKGLEIKDDRVAIEARIEELDKGNALRYPRIQTPKYRLTVKEYSVRYGSTAALETRPAEAVSVCGMCQIVM